MARPSLHQRQRLLHAIDIAEEVGLDELEEIALQELANPLEGSASCIEHEDIEPPVPRADLLEHGRDRVLLADIRLDGHRGGPTFHELLGERLGLRLRTAPCLTIVEDQARSRLAELAGDDSPQPSRATSDQCDPSVTGFHFGFLVLVAAAGIDQPKRRPS